jgi:hypothetical protein
MAVVDIILGPPLQATKAPTSGVIIRSATSVLRFMKDPFDVMWHMMYIHSTVNLIQVPAAEANKLNKHKKVKRWQRAIDLKREW